MTKKGAGKHLREISQVITKLKAVLNADDGSSALFTKEQQILEKKYLDKFHQEFNKPDLKGRSKKEVRCSRFR